MSSDAREPWYCDLCGAKTLLSVEVSKPDTEHKNTTILTNVCFQCCYRLGNIYTTGGKTDFIPTNEDYRIHGRDRVEKWIQESHDSLYGVSRFRFCPHCGVKLE